MDIKIIENALKRAYLLGQQYWQQADSEYVSQHKKADETGNKFTALSAETLKAIEAALAVSVAWKHDCAALLTNDVELWIHACPHCGKPRTVPSKPAPVECEPVAEVLWYEPMLHEPQTKKGHKIIDASLSWMEKAPLGTKLYAAPPAIDDTIKKLIAEFPVYDDEGLSETEHCCEWVMLQERKRLHAILKKLEAE